MTDLEIWLIGTAEQVAAAMTALATTGRIAAASTPEPLYAADAGRVRRYARVATTSRPAATPRTAAPTGGAGQGVIDLAARRRIA